MARNGPQASPARPLLTQSGRQSTLQTILSQLDRLLFQAGDCGGRLSTITSSWVFCACGNVPKHRSLETGRLSEIEAGRLVPWTSSRARPDHQPITQNNRPLRARLDGGKQMRIPPNQVLFLGQRQWAEFDCPQEPLPDEIRILLWLMDGAERRHRLAFRWSGKEPRGTYPIVSFDDLALEPSSPEIRVAREPWPEAVLAAFAKALEAAVQCAL